MQRLVVSSGNFDPPAIARLNTENANYVATGTYNAIQAWANYPSNETFVQCPGLNGGIEADIAVAYGMVYIASYNFCTEGEVTSVGSPSSTNFGITNVQYLSANTTIYAIDANTGKQVWAYFIPNVPFRGWLTVSNNMLFAGSVDGNIYVLNANTGSVLSKIYLGTSLYTSPTIGANSAGNMMIFELIGSPSYGDFQESVPGSLLAFGLPSTYSSFSSGVLYYVAFGALAVSLAYVTIEGLQRFVLKKRLLP